VSGVRRRNEKFGWHAADGGACRAAETVVDKKGLGAGFPSGSLCSQAGGAGTDDRNVATHFRHKAILPHRLPPKREA
jgi:hypothetical protein